jgi:hypothetical protein
MVILPGTAARAQDARPRTYWRNVAQRPVSQDWSHWRWERDKNGKWYKAHRDRGNHNGWYGNQDRDRDHDYNRDQHHDRDHDRDRDRDHRRHED